MTTYKRSLPDVVVAGVVGCAAVLLGVLVVKSPLLTVGAAGLTVLVVAGAVDATIPTIAWLVVAPWVQAIEPGSPLLTLTIAFHRALLPIAAIGAVFGDAVRRRLRLHPAERIYLAFLVLAFVSMYFAWKGRFSTVEGNEALRNFLFAHLVPFGALVMAIRIPLASHKKVLIMLSLVGGVSSAGGIVQSFTGMPVFPGAGVWQEIWDPRAVGPLSNPAVSGYVAQVGVFAAIYLGIRHAGLRLVAIPIVIAGTVYTILTYTRSVWLALALGVVCIAWLDRRARAWVLSFLAIAVLAFSLNVGGFVDRAFLEERAGNQENVEGRLAFGSTGFRMFKDEPLVGQGFGTYDIKSREFAAGFGSVGAGVNVVDTSHNSFLTILAELGALGFLLYAAAMFAGVKGAVSALRRGGPNVDRMKVVALLAGFLAYFVTANLIDMRFFSFANSVFWASVGLLIAIGGRSAEPQQS